MNCDPKALIEAAKCFRCIPHSRVNNIAIYLLCQWANSEPPPVDQIAWTPETENVNWVDVGGPHTGNLAFFLATADLPSVSILDFIGPGSVITSIVGLSHIPAVTILDFTLSNLSTIDVTGLTSLSNLGLSTNGLLTSISGLNTCASLSVLTCDSCNLSAINVSGLNLLATLNCDFNPLLGSVNVSGCNSLGTLSISGCSLLSLDLSSCTSLSLLNVNNNVALTAITLTDLCATYSNMSINGCALPAENTGIGDPPTGINSFYDHINTGSSLNAGTISTIGNAAVTVGPPDGVAARGNLIGNGWAVAP